MPRNDGAHEETEPTTGGPPQRSPGPEVGTRFSAAEIHEHLELEAQEELKRPAGELTYSAVASGMLVAFSLLAAAFLRTMFPERLHTAAAALGYPLGFIFVVLARHQLFTENTLEPVIPLLERRDAETFGKVARLWSIVLPANLVGALAIAAALAFTRALEPEVSRAALEISREATSGGFALVLYKGIWAGWLIALMAWLVASTHDTTAQILLVWLSTAPIAAFGFRHSIAGAVEAFYRAFVGDAGWGEMLGAFELPAIIGNVIGGVVLVAMVNHGQAGGRKR